MQELIAQIFSYIWGIWRFRWLAMIVAWVIALGGWLFVQQMPESFVGTARIYVDSNNLLRPLLQGLAIQPNISQRIAMMSRTLLSRPNLEKVMRMTDLDLQVQTDREKEDMLAALRENMLLSGDRQNASLYSIKVKDADRDTAKRITQALITVFIESGLSGKRQDSSGAQGFLNDQIAEYEVRMAEAEGRLAAFKQRYVGALPGQAGGYYQRLELAKQKLKEAQLQLREAENRRAELQRQIDSEEPAFLSSGMDAFGSPLDMRIQALNAQMDALLSRYTERHPEVRQIRALIADMEAEKLAELEAAQDDDFGGVSAGLSESPIYQGMRAMLTGTDAQVAQLRVRVGEYEKRVADLKEKVNNIPVIETELKQLDRDYQVISGQHFIDPQDQLNLTRYTQPALLTHSIASLEVFRDLTGDRLQPVMTAGHSLGEYSALVAAKALSFENALKLVQQRGELMGTHGEGEMTAFPLEIETIRPVAERYHCAIAGCNLPQQTVIGGRSEDLAHAERDILEQFARKRPVRLKTEGAFHTYYMVKAAQLYRSALETAVFDQSEVRVLSNFSGDFHQADPATIRAKLFFQLFNPVLWYSNLQAAFGHGVDMIVEFGGGIGTASEPAGKRPNLEGMIKKSLRGTDFAADYLSVINTQTLQNSVAVVNGLS